MKQYNKNHLPEIVKYNGEDYLPNAAIDTAMILNNTSLKTISDTLKKESRKCLCVNVLSRNLKGKTDLYKQPYKPTKHIFTTTN